MYEPHDYSHLKGTPGFSDNALDIHFKLYEGYVANTNKLLETFGRMEKEGKNEMPEYAELKRRLGWEFDGMRLHEFYFPQLGGTGEINRGGKLYKAFEENFGSFDAWKENFISIGKIRGIGWAALYQDPANGKLINFWINEHNEGHPASANLILIMDVFEHAYVSDYGTDRAGYIDAFWKNLKWEEVEKRLL